MDLAVVTSCWGEYAAYLPDWADSIVTQTVPPAQTVIVDAGCRDTGPLNEAAAELDRAGIPVAIDKIRYQSLGGARNAATALAGTEWCIHLDADDMLLPHAIADIAAVTATADVDVVSLGAMRNGQPVVFPDITAAKILARQHGMFSCGAFRRSLWQQRPWHTHNDWVDSTFWVGLAHLGARFASTGRVGFYYRQHHDSISHSLTPRQRKAAIDQWKRACDQWTLN